MALVGESTARFLFVFLLVRQVVGSEFASARLDATGSGRA